MTEHEKIREELALYAVGALTPEEMTELELHLTGCPRCREELRSLHAAAAQIALAVEPVPPPSALREQWLARVESQPVEPIADQAGTSQRGLRLPPTRGLLFWVPAFAALLLAVAGIALRNQNRNLSQQNHDLAVSLAANRKSLERSTELLNALTAPDAQRVTLVTSGTKVQPEARAVYSPRVGSLVLLADHLNILPEHKTYELWLLPANGSKPVPAGTFKPDQRGGAVLLLSQFGDGIEAKGFAVTMENEPGSSTPTMPILMSGTV